MTKLGERVIRVRDENDVSAAREAVRAIVAALGFSPAEIALVVTSVSELAHNMVEHAGGGVVRVHAADRDGVPGVVAVAEDTGPGIASIAQALTDGFSTGRGLGLGLPGAQRMMHELDIHTEVGRGTVVTIKRWRDDRL